MSTVIIGCKLPHGLVLNNESGKRFVLRGANDANAVGGYGLTAVDGDFWKEWAQMHANYPPYRSGAIFVSDTPEQAAKTANSDAAQSVITGFEGLSPSNPLPDEGANVNPNGEGDNTTEQKEKIAASNDKKSK